MPNQADVGDEEGSQVALVRRQVPHTNNLPNTTRRNTAISNALRLRSTRSLPTLEYTCSCGRRMSCLSLMIAPRNFKSRYSLVVS